MEYSKWHGRNERPDYNGVYEWMDLSKPDAPTTYRLYKKGWHIDCNTIDAAYRSTEKHNESPFNFETRGSTKALKMGGVIESPKFQWRGLAKQPRGMKIEGSDKWPRR